MPHKRSRWPVHRAYHGIAYSPPPELSWASSFGANTEILISAVGGRRPRRSVFSPAIEDAAATLQGFLDGPGARPARESAFVVDIADLGIDDWLAGLPHDHSYEMFPDEKYATAPSTPSRGSLSVNLSNSDDRLSVADHPSSGFRFPGIHVAGFRSWGLTPRKILTAVAVIIFLFFVKTLYSLSQAKTVRHPSYARSDGIYNSSFLPNAAFQPPEALLYRMPDTLDTFAGYKYRNTCNISSLDLHAPFAPLCPDRASMLTAMSSGGRIGHDAPYMPRGCDMRWFSTEEVCEILSRFDKVIIVGDSMMRHVIGSINVLMRKDLGYGAVTDWNFSPEERKECFCNLQFNVKACSVQGIFKTSDIVKNDPDSIACPAGTVDIMIEQMIRFPIPAEEAGRYKELIGKTKPAKPYAFVFGHGLWNDLDLQATLDWLDEILDMTTAQLPYLSTPGSFWPRLILTPNAAGKEKPDQWLVTQGNKALQIFEESVKVEAGRRGVEHLGTWNMSVQSNKYDGVHVDLKGNLVKAMMVMNWLNMLEVEKH